MVCLPFCVTKNHEEALDRLAQFANYRDIPSYRAMLDREGVDHPRDIATAGDEDVVRAPRLTSSKRAEPPTWG